MSLFIIFDVHRSYYGNVTLMLEQEHQKNTLHYSFSIWGRFK